MNKPAVFHDDLEAGKGAEELILSLFGGTPAPDGCFKDYDLVTTTGKTVEVKRDLMYRNTGNLYIEYQCSGHPSGIAVTTADYWIIVGEQNVMLMLSVAMLRDYIMKYKLPSVTNGIAIGYLISDVKSLMGYQARPSVNLQRARQLYNKGENK